MPRRVGQGVVVAPKGGAAPVPPKVAAPKRRGGVGFEAGGGKQPVALDAGVAKPEATKQRAVFDVVPQHPETVTAALQQLRQLDGVKLETLGDIDGIPVQVATVSGAPPPAGVEPKRVLITGGVHGSEPAGCISAVQLLAMVAEHPEAFAGLQFTVVPLVNPEGFRDSTRQNENDHSDLNREVVRDGSVPKEIELLLPVLDRWPWSLALDLHASGSTTADGDNGFFAIRTEGNGELLHAVMSEFAQTHPVLDETTQRYDMVEPGVMQSHNTGTVKGYLFERGTRAAFTLEAPALKGVDSQVSGLLDLVQGFSRRVA